MASADNTACNPKKCNYKAKIQKINIVCTRCSHLDAKLLHKVSTIPDEVRASVVEISQKERTLVEI